MKVLQKQYFNVLRALVVEGYEIFSEYQLDTTKSLDACLCSGCTIKEDHDYLIHTELKNIDIEVFKHYVNAAYSEGKTPLKEFKYFLPLFIDFMVQGNQSWISEGYFFKRVNHYLRHDWTHQELVFLQQFAENYIYYHLYESGGAEFQTIEDFLDMFESYLFNTEKLAEKCLNHPSAFCLIDYATQIMNHGYDKFEQEDEFTLYSKRVGQILLNWKYDPEIKNHFIEKYKYFNQLGKIFDLGDEQLVREWIKQVV